MDNRRWKQVPRRLSDEPFRAETPVELSQESLFRLAAQLEDCLARSVQTGPAPLRRRSWSRSRYIE
ncbi:MAG: hypothetical protein JOY92_00985 [Verrucomicrobia bacterium]|nr:hypothetical protein [Verrucomicrobiota bacterium]